MRLFFGVLFGAIGMGYIVYGRKQRHGVALLCGVLLGVLPYFLDNPYLVVGIGIGLCLAPFLVRD